MFRLYILTDYTESYEFIAEFTNYEAAEIYGEELMIRGCIVDYEVRSE